MFDEMRVRKLTTFLIVTIKKQNPWFAIIPWNVKPVAEPKITAIIAENEKV
jgi:hypothetical protein